MAGDTEVIRQFLVSLGFAVDQAGVKKFLGSLDATAKTALTTSKAVIGVAVAAEAMVMQFASSMEKLYYQSKRTGASVENLQSLEFGSRKIGIAAGVAREALEGMVSAARMNPGMRGLIDGLLGKNTEGLDQAQVMLELVQKLAEMPHYQGAQYASMFGMDERTFFMLKQGLPELIAAEQERRNLNRQAGIDAEAAAKAGQEYANSIRDITERISILRDKLSVEMLPAFREFNRDVVTALDNLAKFNLAEHPRANATVKGTAETVSGAGKAIRDVGAGVLTLDGPRLWSGLKGMVYNAPGTAAIRGAWNWATGQDAVGRAEHERRHTSSGKIKYAPPHISGNAAEPLGLRQNNPGNLRSWGPVPQQNGFAVFPTASSGLSAMAAQLLMYYDRDGLKNVRDIIAKWAPSSENNTGAYINAVSKRLGVGAGQALNLKDPAVLSRLMGAMVQQEQGYNPFGSAELLAAAQAKLGGQGKQITITQKTDIHVNGGDSPAETGRAVALVQDEVTGNMVRNMRGAVQ